MTPPATMSLAAPETVRAITDAVTAILGALDPTQRKKASFRFDDEGERRDWAYFPRDFHGLSLKEMTGEQQTLIGRLLEAALSLPAQAKAGTIMALESVLGRIEGHRSFARDPGLYFLSVFGDPAAESPWAFRFEGHHVCLNFTLRDGSLLSPTPIFLGSNPAEVFRGENIILRPLAEEEDVARALLKALDPAQRQKAVICETAPRDFVLRNAPRIPDAVVPGDIAVPALLQIALETLPDALRQKLRYDRARPSGLAAADMSGPQREILQALLSVYFDRLPDEAATAARERLEAAGIAEVHFAWAGETERRRPHYYRIQGPSLLIEYDNTQNDANHIHSVWRDPDGDFGEDLLRRHLSGAHPDG